MSPGCWNTRGLRILTRGARIGKGEGATAGVGETRTMVGEARIRVGETRITDHGPFAYGSYVFSKIIYL